MKKRKMDQKNQILCGDSLAVLKTLPSESVQCVVTSPPYWGLRDYGFAGQIGMEKTPEEYVNHLVDIFHDIRRVLRQDGVFWLNLGDSYFSTQTTTGGCSPKSTLSGGGGPNSRQGSKNEFLYNTQPKVAHKKVIAHVKPKDLIGIPWMVAFALRADGWYLRSDIIWAKPNPMPESVTDRPTKSHEHIFLLTKSPHYYYDAKAIAEDANPKHFGQYKYDFWPKGTKENNGGGRPGAASNTSGKKEYDGKRNKRDVWTITTKSYRGAHFATFPEKLVEPCILAGSQPGDVVMDPFAGSGTTLAVALRLGRHYLGIEGNPKYMKLIRERIKKVLDEKD